MIDLPGLSDFHPDYTHDQLTLELNGAISVAMEMHRVDYQCFLQLETSVNGQLHMHIALDLPEGGHIKNELGRALKAFLARHYHNHDPTWIKPKRTGNAWKPIDFKTFCKNYLLNKLECEYHARHMYVNPDFHNDDLSEWFTDDGPSTSGAPSTKRKRADDAEGDVALSSAGAQYQKIIDTMMEKHCFTIKDVLTLMPGYYSNMMAKGKKSQIIATLNDAKDRMLMLSTAYDLAQRNDDYVGYDEDQLVEGNVLLDIVKFQGYDPMVFCANLIKWLNLDLGKRNAFTIFGPGSTGKSVISKAIRCAVNNYGEVNKNNENFPFNDCHGKHLVVWEEGTMKESFVEQAKQIFEGSECRVDKKGSDSCTIMPTPVVCTTNSDLSIVHSGNTVNYDQMDTLRLRMWGMQFNKSIKFGTAEFPYPYPEQRVLVECLQKCLYLGKTNMDKFVCEYSVPRIPQ